MNSHISSNPSRILKLTCLTALPLLVTGLARTTRADELSPIQCSAEYAAYSDAGVGAAAAGVAQVAILGDQALVRFDPAADTVVTYQRLTQQDAEALGFKVAADHAVFTLQGDESLPGAYVILPRQLTGRTAFNASYGTLNEAGEFDPAQVTRLCCSAM